MPLKALIIDDEPAARSELRFLLESRGDVTVLGEAASAPEAIALIANIPYDIIFLDINMPGSSGLDLATEIHRLERKPAIVFVTAYSEHAARAFDLDAIDYLVKPVSEQRLERCIQRARRHLEKTPSRPEAPASTHIARMFVDADGKKVAVDYEDINFFEAVDDYARLHTDTATYLIHVPLKALEDRLSGHDFLRIHRKYLVNAKKVAAIIPLSRSALVVKLGDGRGTELPVSRRKARRIREALGL